MIRGGTTGCCCNILGVMITAGLLDGCCGPTLAVAIVLYVLVDGIVGVVMLT